jgi:two-component system phosphate regulon sensor histidine kinase PhoR
VVAYGAVRRLSKPVEQMTEAAERAAGGELRTGLCLGGDDEIGRLCSAVDRMRLALIREIDDLDAERVLFASVVAGIRDGLLLVDGELRVAMANEGFRETFGVTIDPVGRLLAEVVRNPQIIGFLEASIREGREIRDQEVRIPESGRSFEFHVTPLPGDPGEPARGALALFFDITRLEALENVRQSFVANVSHELRTPLTSIRAFVETLLDGGMDDVEHRERFLGIVQRQVIHMAGLIDDLADLSRIETGAVTLDVAELTVVEVVRDAVEQVESRHGGSDVEIVVEVPEELAIAADRLRLAQILVNLVDNAVKFNRPGGNVTVAGEAAGETVRIQVRDTGTGIPSDSLDKIFNRFYRVDTARSKDVPGTGLGLSIVKHLTRLHGGVIRVESEYGQGSTFTLEFPARPGAISSGPDRREA